ncbi:MAG: hypothetical protein Kow0062_25530 [Acidobacteriota bacterium]
MSRLLTSEEMDALLKTEGEAGDAADDARAPAVEFSLRNPVVLSAERLAAAQKAFERLAPELARELTGLLCSEEPVTVRFAGIVQVPAAKIFEGDSAPDTLGLLDGPGEQLWGGLALHPSLAAAILDRLQGGRGEAGERGALTPVERELLAVSFARLVGAVARQRPGDGPRAAGVETEPAEGRLADYGGVFAAVQYRVTTPFGEALLRAFVTSELIDWIVEPPERKERSPEPSVELAAALTRVPVRLELCVEGATARYGDLRRLAPGQVLQLDVRETDLLALKVNGGPLARGRLRQDGAGSALAIEEFVRRTSGSAHAADSAARGATR